MFSRQHRKVRVLFALADIVLITLAFEAAYQTRVVLHLERVFFLTVVIKTLVLGFSLGLWVAIGLWLNVYDKLDAGDPRVVLRDSFLQSVYGSIGLVVFEFALRL